MKTLFIILAALSVFFGLYPDSLLAQEPSAGPGKQSAETIQVEPGSKDKSAAEIPQSVSKPPQASDQGTKEKQPDKSGVTEPPPKPGSTEKKGQGDRRWITRTRPDEKKPAPKKDLPPLTWAGDEQKKRCDSLLQPLKENYTKARDSSIQGDSCATAEHSKAFLTYVDSCKKDCPKEFLERNGYDKALIRNLGHLQKSGTERCLGAAAQKKQEPKPKTEPKK
jgi:hypothetical protein